MSAARRRLDDLLLARAAAGLDAPELAELERLLAAHPDVDPEVYDRVAASVCLASLDTSAPLPDSLRAKLERQAAAFVASALPARR
jgi:hypothetical protein